ncbi:hypothetical protein COCMIDRAFT_85945 [Bipolaris oryzae ATCC 44560]|uniref:Ecp2 effector protein domain-containing protein n=1 Tax=Bipolaris oryzae ATCC 44560 TaxID=930090 RepID=W6ZN64_COCMI|nr:uncharacterized protein COCMIDRAFT_85945 [Bipolaris oryzae ATCC 44560]EUC48944.1 hypothetical protein COCMIDRAFT_85945 [Bipolaris oryzae ATCC 44560]
MLATLFLLAATIATPAIAGIQQSDFSGIGNIYVLKSDNWQTATPKATVGCLDNNGKFISEKSPSNKCGVFSRLDDFPYTLSTSKGNCTFEDDKQDKNTDSYYGKTDSAWSCGERVADIYDQLYTINGFPYVFLCFGDVACFYDAKHTPSSNEVLPFWQYRWGSQQMGITPGHVQLQLMWKKIDDLPGRSEASEFLGPRVRVEEGSQIPLLGKKARV